MLSLRGAAANLYKFSYVAIKILSINISDGTTAVPKKQRLYLRPKLKPMILEIVIKARIHSSPPRSSCVLCLPYRFVRLSSG